MPEPGELLAQEAQEKREALLAAVDTRPGYWWPPDELRAAAGVSGPMAMYALCRMANPEYDDTLELDSRLRVRRAAVSVGVSLDILREQGPMSLRDLTAATAKRMGRSLLPYDDVEAVMRRHDEARCTERANDRRDSVWSAAAFDAHARSETAAKNQEQRRGT